MTLALAIVLPLLAAAPDSKPAAEQLFDRASSEYAHGEFSAALEDFESAYRFEPIPGFLFNIAQCYRELGQWQKATDFYRRYLEAKPDAKNAPVVRELLTEAEAKASQETEVRSRAEPAPDAAVTAPAPGRRSAGWGRGLVGGGAGLAVVGAVLGGISLGNGDTTSPGMDGVHLVTDHSITLAAANSANSLATASVVLVSVGVAGVIGGIVWLVTR